MTVIHFTHREMTEPMENSTEKLLQEWFASVATLKKDVLDLKANENEDHTLRNAFMMVKAR